MSLVRVIARNTFIQVAGKAASTALGIAAVAIMTRYLGAEQFGWYATAVGFLQFVGIVSDFGFTVTTSNMLSEAVVDKQKILSTLFTWRFITALIFQGLAPLVILFFPYAPPIKQAVAITTLSFFALALTQVFVGYYREKLQMTLVVMSELFGRILLLVGVILVAQREAGFLPLMAVITMASLGSTAYLWFKMGWISFKLEPTITRVMFYKMWPTAISVICNAVYLQGDRVILPLYVSANAVGYYGAAYRVLDIVIQIAAIVMGLVMPLITYAWSRQLKDDFQQRYQLAFDLLALLMLPMVAGLAVLGRPIMVWVAGPDFAPAGAVLRWLSLSIFGTCFGMIFGHIALAINRQREALWIYASDAALSLLGYFLFIPRFGIAGAIGVTVFSELYAGALLMALTVYYSRFAPRLLTFLKIIMSSALMASVLYLLPPLPVWLMLITGSLTYGLTIIGLRIISWHTIREALFFPR